MLLPSNGRGGQRAEMLRKREVKQEFQFSANGWASEASISRNYHCINVFQAAFFTVEYGVIFLVIPSLTSGYNQKLSVNTIIRNLLLCAVGKNIREGCSARKLLYVLKI